LNRLLIYGGRRHACHRGVCEFHKHGSSACDLHAGRTTAHRYSGIAPNKRFIDDDFNFVLSHRFRVLSRAIANRATPERAARPFREPEEIEKLGVVR